MKNQSDEIFVEQLRAIKFPDCSNYTSVNDTYQDFVTKLLSVIGFVTPIKTLSVKSNTKPWFDIDFLNANNQARKMTNAILLKCANSKGAKFFLKKVINDKKNLYLEEKIAENKNNPKELW